MEIRGAAYQKKKKSLYPVSRCMRFVLTTTLHINPRLALALCTSNELNARLLGMHLGQQKPWKVMDFRTKLTNNSIHLYEPSSLEHIIHFVRAIRQELRRHPSKTLIACVGRCDAGLRSRVAMLFGCFLILEENLDVEQVADLFGAMGNQFESLGSSVRACWRALSHARKLGWLHLARSLDSIDDIPVEIEEMLHYASPINGDIHVVVPGKIICFPTPADLPDNQLWADSDAARDGTIRRFSATFFADLFADLGVDVAVCLYMCAYDRAAFLERGIEVEDLCMDPSSPHMLSALDRFLTLAAAAPGLVALQSGSDGPGHLGALVLSYLTRRLGFDAESAVAWVRMIHPALLATPASPTPPNLAATLHGEDLLVRAASASPPSPFTAITAAPSSRFAAFVSFYAFPRSCSAPTVTGWSA